MMEPPDLREPPAIVAQVEQPPRRSVAAKPTFQWAEVPQRPPMPQLPVVAIPNQSSPAERPARSSMSPVQPRVVPLKKPCRT